VIESIILDGCQLEPLSSYLKALGVHRLVAEQVDPEAAGWWQAGRYLLRSQLESDAVVEFLVTSYHPTPLVAPWNGRGGFRTDQRRESEKAVQEIEASTDERLAPYREAIAATRGLYESSRWAEKDKATQVLLCREKLPDQVVDWLDAAVVLTGDGAVYPPLLGTGGNLGSMDLSNNFMQRVTQVLAVRQGRRAPTVDDSRAWARAALFDRGQPALIGAAVGQFDPGGAGGVNAAPVGQAGSLVNPWDFVLLLEGSLLFASAVARRLGADQRGRAAMPFTFDPSAVGYASGAEGEGSKGEVWAPVWQQPVTLPEISYLLGEGRAAWRGRQARTGLDMAKAVSSLGVDRGVHRFVRHAFVERLGQSTIAVPVGHMRVTQRPDVNLLADLASWTDRLGREGRRQGTPAAVVAALQRVESAEYEVARRGGSRQVQGILEAVAAAEQAVARATAFRGRSGLGPLPWMDPDRWLPLLDDGTAELRLAGSLALAHDTDGSNLRSMTQPIRLDGRSRRPAWSDAPSRVEGLGRRPIASVLADCLMWRARNAATDRHSSGPVGVEPAFTYGPAPKAGDVAALAAGAVDVDRLDRLLRALLILRPGQTRHRWQQAGEMSVVEPPLWSLLAPFFARTPLQVGEVTVELRAQPEWPALLVANRAGEVATQALRRLRMARLQPVATSAARLASVAAPDTGAASAVRLAAALMCHPGRAAAQEALQRSIDPDRGEAA